MTSSFNASDYDYLLNTLIDGSIEAKNETLHHLLILVNKDQN